MFLGHSVQTRGEEKHLLYGYFRAVVPKVGGGPSLEGAELLQGGLSKAN